MKHEKSCGAVVYRMENGEIYILVEHMVQGHCSIPKGHVEGSETEAETALREIREETALRVELDTGFRHVITYSPGPGVEKDVVFFAARALNGEIEPQLCELHSARFLPPDEAIEALTFESDRETVRQAAEYILKK